MKFALTTSFDSPYKGVADLTLPVLMEYADRHGYELMVKQNPWDAQGIIQGRVTDMLAYNGPADWIVHVDADVLITNLEKPLGEFVSDTLIVVGSDHNGINDGMLFLRNTNQAKQLMMDIARGERDCFQANLAERLLDDPQLSKFVSIAPQRTFNSYLKGEYPDQDPEGIWQEGDFAIHLPGRSNPRRVEILNQIIPLIQR